MDIFHRNQQAVGGVFTSDKAVATIAAGSGSWVAALVQNVQADYAQAVQPFYELGSNLIYRVLGRPEGRMQIGRIIGKAGSSAIEDALFDACTGGGTMTIQANANLCNAQGGSITMVFSGLFVMSYGVAINVNDLLIRENIQLAFTSFNKYVK